MLNKLAQIEAKFEKTEAELLREKLFKKRCKALAL